LDVDFDEHLLGNVPGLPLSCLHPEKQEKMEGGALLSANRFIFQLELFFG
jgi:hypothetical protein